METVRFSPNALFRCLVNGNEESFDIDGCQVTIHQGQCIISYLCDTEIVAWHSMHCIKSNVIGRALLEDRAIYRNIEHNTIAFMVPKITDRTLFANACRIVYAEGTVTMSFHYDESSVASLRLSSTDAKRFAQAIV